ncbi:DoxX family protein [Paenibacillus chartarius]|uniref:DoxX family protein n=1 Tax=Paenibacillus chartarius TaxID=747481 RepID=A0ABV6DTR5_9BACL
MASKSLKIAVMVLKGILSANFIMVGSMKVIGAEDAVGMFVHYGYPIWFCMVVGLIEIAGGIGLWIRKLANYALFALMAIMTGALVTHILFEEYVSVLIIIVYLLLLMAVAFYDRSRSVRRSASLD